MNANHTVLPTDERLLTAELAALGTTAGVVATFMEFLGLLERGRPEDPSACPVGLWLAGRSWHNVKVEADYVQARASGSRYPVEIPTPAPISAFVVGYDNGAYDLPAVA